MVWLDLLSALHGNHLMFEQTTAVCLALLPLVTYLLLQLQIINHMSNLAT
jgi:hypothetical protein